jgi:hypothetical protein
MQPYPPPAPRSSSPVPWIAAAAVGLVAAGLLGFAVGRASVSAAPATTRTVTAVATETETTERAPARTTAAASTSSGVQAGTHVVGRDIQPGQYRTGGDAQGGPCYWARLSDTSGDRSAIIANDIAHGATTITIESGDGAFKTSGCQDWVKVG